jgi:pantoate kinase
LKNPSSMIMLGKGLFALVREKEDEKAKKLLADMGAPYDIAEIYMERPKVGRWVE